jgi:hypothetical protein
LEEFVGLTGHNSCYESWLLRNCGRKIILSSKNGEQLVNIGEVRKIEHRRPRVYDEEFKRVLIWELLDYCCGNRLVAGLR